LLNAFRPGTVWVEKVGAAEAGCQWLMPVILATKEAENQKD
jgi:hypothetical protein